MKRILMTLCAALALGAASAAETTPALGDEKSLYDLLDLDRPGMEAVKKAVESMTGMEVAAVNVNVAGIALQPPKANQ